MIGVSWRGGGKAGRIAQKSIPTGLFSSILKDIPNVRFVSLQYGESKPIVEEWCKKGIDILHDENIDAMNDLYGWLSQVAACDAVISVANTTIHGAGGLNIPTQCLLGDNSDWRWLDNPFIKRSYWYPSVGIIRKNGDDQWKEASNKTRQWILNGTPFPEGIRFDPSLC